MRCTTAHSRGPTVQRALVHATSALTLRTRGEQVLSVDMRPLVIRERLPLPDS